MTAGWRFTLIGDPLCAMVERASLALSARGTDFDRRKPRSLSPASSAQQPAGAALFICDPQGQSLTVTDSLIMLDVIEDLHPLHPLYPKDPLQKALMRDTMQVAVRAFTRLSPVVEARVGNDLDIAVFFLRESLKQVSDRVALAAHPRVVPSHLTNQDIALAPLLWRLGLLDASFNSYLLSGLNLLADHRERILSHPLCAALYTRPRAQGWIAEVIGLGGLLIPPDKAAAVIATAEQHILNLAPTRRRIGA